MTEEVLQNTLETVDEAEYALVCVPWKGSPCFVKVRKLDDITIQAIGNFSLIENKKYTWSKKREGYSVDWNSLYEQVERSSAICRASLVSPSYEQLMGIVGKHGFMPMYSEQLREAEEQYSSMQPGPAKQELSALIASIKLAFSMLLPSDFMNGGPFIVNGVSDNVVHRGVVQVALRIGETDIDKVVEEMLYTAAALAERSHKAPHEYLKGRFSDFNIRDIDTRAWILFGEKEKEALEKLNKK